ncbi:MAG: YceI family protein [Balneola sp.]
MKDGKFIILCICIFSMLVGARNTFARQTNEIKSIILEESKLRINGTSNLNDFECIYEDEIEPDTLTHNVEVRDTSIAVQGDDISLKIDSFNCGKRGINRDFRKTLKSDVYPNIEIELLSIVSPNGQPTLANIATTLGGVTREYTIVLRDYEFLDDLVIVSGTNEINMTDFGISPPTALFGMIKVKDQISIDFTLSIKR